MKPAGGATQAIQAAAVSAIWCGISPHVEHPQRRLGNALQQLRRPVRTHPRGLVAERVVTPQRWKSSAMLASGSKPLGSGSMLGRYSLRIAACTDLATNSLSRADGMVGELLSPPQVGDQRVRAVEQDTASPTRTARPLRRR